MHRAILLKFIAVIEILEKKYRKLCILIFLCVFDRYCTLDIYRSVPIVHLTLHEAWIVT
jgi:hypothetical protein